MRLMFCYRKDSAVNKPTLVTRYTVLQLIIYLTNSIINVEIKSAIIKIDISIIFITPVNEDKDTKREQKKFIQHIFCKSRSDKMSHSHRVLSKNLTVPIMFTFLEFFLFI